MSEPAYLTITGGHRVGSQFRLDPDQPTHIGRGPECTIVLTDPLCSRVHATITRAEASWQISDCQSRNGTFVDEQRVTDPLRLSNGASIRIGSTQFEFQERLAPSESRSADGSLTQTVVKETWVGNVDATSLGAVAPTDPDHAHDLLLLHQLSIKLLTGFDPHALLTTSLELLKARTKATIVGFLWVSDSGDLKPKLVIPEQSAERVSLSEELTRLVCEQKHAVWIANQQSVGDDSTLKHYADALCVPLVHRQKVLGAIHVYLDQGRFRQSHFEFAISLANITAMALARALHEESLSAHFERLKEESPGYDELVGESAAMRELKDRIARLARAQGCVLIRGESGTGKELVARALHRASPRADRPLLAVNCAAIPAELMESQLFGHKAGAFTGAERDHVGYFQQADLGTLFLDEVGELTLQGQGKLLRILEGHPFLPVGATKELTVDVRVIAATNRDLLGYVQEKKFREDLYYRLNVFELVLPPLRERDSDIAVLIDFFLDHFCRKHGRHGLVLSEGARQKLLGYAWPGNVRQLRNVIDSAVALARGNRIEADDLPLRDGMQADAATLRLEDWEKKLIAEALRRTQGNVPEAAQLLGIGRATLYRKLDHYGIAR